VKTRNVGCNNMRFFLREFIKQSCLCPVFHSQKCFFGFQFILEMERILKQVLILGITGFLDVVR
jgi:hypothetical protein